MSEMTVATEFEAPSDFTELLDDAESNATTGWEMDLVADLKAKYDKYGDKMFISQKQIDALNRVARRD